MGCVWCVRCPCHGVHDAHHMCSHRCMYVQRASRTSQVRSVCICMCMHRYGYGYACERVCMPERASERVPRRARACLHVCARACACVCVCARTHPTHPLPPSMYSNYFCATYVHFWTLTLHVETASLDIPFSDSVLTLKAQSGKVCGPRPISRSAFQSIELCQRVIQV